MLPNPEVREINLQDIIKIVKKRWGIIAFIAVAIPCFVTISVFKEKPMYKATASIVISPSSMVKVTKIEEVYKPELDPQYIQTQFKILGSRALSEKVLTDLNLTNETYFKNLKDPAGFLNSHTMIEGARNSSVVYVRFDDEDPIRAARITNALVRAYINQSLETRNSTTKEAIGWLEKQLVGIRANIESSEKALNDYIQKSRIISTADDVNKSQSVLQNLKIARSSLIVELSKGKKRYKSKHPKMISLNAQLDELNKTIAEETARNFQLSNKMVQYNMLKQDVDSNKSLYASLLVRAKETDVSGKLETSNIQLLDSATPPSKPYKPKRAQAIFLSILLSIFGGAGIAFFLEYLDSSIRTAEDVSNYINIPFLGYIPACFKEVKSDLERSLICYKQPSSVVTESYRALRTAILFSSPEDKPLKTILVTSSLPQEGKSFVSVNLSTIFSQINERVILVDVDMRRPKLHKSLSIGQNPGLSAYLIGKIDLDSIIKPLAIPNLHIITSGSIPPNSTELLTSGKLNLLLEELKKKFDRIILDSPPVQPIKLTGLFL
ncbi:MAG: polysaccharide biosynthesis tyrosine autokinase [Candidatus Omnitrophica bacterium]|nr:polysaccharide biosynthesis tyrosine autokinase [Candidatus Omnitrophota bacterium]